MGSDFGRGPVCESKNHWTFPICLTCTSHELSRLGPSQKNRELGTDSGNGSMERVMKRVASFFVIFYSTCTNRLVTRTSFTTMSAVIFNKYEIHVEVVIILMVVD